MKKQVIVVAGPTASGKTALGIELALHFGGEVVSADSMQIYRRMDIGTAKPTAEELSRVPHHMIDIADPDEDYSVARYVDEAVPVCDALLDAGKIPVIVGGTGLYIDSLLSGRNFGARDSSLSLREELNNKYDTLGGEALLKELSSFDPDRAAILHAADKKRIVRAFEVYLLTGETITEHDEKTKRIPPRYDPLFVIPGYLDRALLYRCIDSRVDRMISEGLFHEVHGLLDSGVPETCTAMQAIGYKEAVLFLKGDLSAEASADLIKQSSRRYAKRQITWFSRRSDALRLYRDTLPSADDVCREAIKYIEERL